MNVELPSFGCWYGEGTKVEKEDIAVSGRRTRRRADVVAFSSRTRAGLPVDGGANAVGSARP